MPPTYFFPDDTVQQDAVPAELAAALSDDKVREMALRAAGLSDRSLTAITDMPESTSLCAGGDPEAFFPSRDDPGAEARQTCAVCPVRSNCLDYATAADEFGIWAASTSRKGGT